MYGHLVTVKVGIEGSTHQRMELNGLALDQYRFECLDAQPVQGRRPIEHDRVFTDHLGQDIPYLGAF